MKQIKLTEKEINLLWKKAVEDLKKNPNKHPDLSMIRLVNKIVIKDRKRKILSRIINQKVK